MDEKTQEKLRHLFGKLSKCEFDQRAIAESVGAAMRGETTGMVCANATLAEALHARITKQVRGWGAKAARNGMLWNFEGGGSIGVALLPMPKSVGIEPPSKVDHLPPDANSPFWSEK